MAETPVTQAGVPGGRLTIDDEIYPPLLRRISNPPEALFFEGDASLLLQPQIAVIGSRNPTSAGLDHARAFAAELSKLGFTVTSGLAAGIDATAHRAALDTGGSTIAVNGTGLDIVYPQGSTSLAEEIRVKGLMVSEFPPGTPARRQNFPSRNRIISGLSLGVLVIEAGLNSGSLITARLAGEQGREVFALPGSLHNPMVKGCHRLIKQGARLTESTDEIVAELAPLASELAQELQERLGAVDVAGQREAPPEAETELLADPEYASLWSQLGHDPVSTEQLMERCGLSAREVSSMILMMELQGMVETVHGRHIRRSPA